MFSEYTIHDYKGAFEGYPTIVCGLGMSLSKFTPDYQIQYHTFGVNDINDHDGGFTPTFQVISEPLIEINYTQNYLKQKCQVIYNTQCQNIFSVYDCGFVYSDPVKLSLIDVRDNNSIESIYDQGSIPAYRKVTTAAIGLAMWMGFNPIGIIGFDLCGGRWVCPKSNNVGTPKERWGEFKQFVQLYEDYAIEQGIKIYNLSDVSRLECFEKITLEEFHALAMV